MSAQNSLHAARIHPAHPDYAAIMGWPFPSAPFYVSQVLDLLRDDLPHRVLFSSHCFVWLYRDSAGTPVGFGCLDVCDEYLQYADGRSHCYVPVLAVHPEHKGNGYGKQIVEHLVSESVLFHESPHDLSDLLLLDVYQANTPAIGLYAKCGFDTLNVDNPMIDAKQNNEPFVVMARKLA